MTKYVNADGLNMRKGPGTSYQVITVLSKDAAVEIISESNGWSNIKYGAQIGYVSTQYLIEKTITSPTLPKKIVNTDGLNMRKGPGTSYAIIMVLSKDVVVEIISESNGWSNIKYGVQIGYVSTQYLAVKSTVTPSAPLVSSEIIKKAIDMAKSKLGCAYVWGAAGPNTFDCSGLMYYIFKINLNINIPRVSKDMSKYGKAVDIKNLQPGDLLFFDTDGINDGNVSHVGMYLGNDQFIQASSGNTMKVVISTLLGYYSKQFVNARRIV